MTSPENPEVVLIVEDETRLREGLARALPAMGFAARAAASAEEAEAIMTEEAAPIVILDLRLPGMNGMRFFERLREQWPDTQVIIQTGFGNLDAAKQAVHLDAVEFLTKPCTLTELETAIDRAWRKWRELTKGPNTRRPAPHRVAEEDAAPGEGPRSLQDIERATIIATLDRHDGNRTTAAAELGISRRTLQYRIKQYGLGQHPSD